MKTSWMKKLLLASLMSAWALSPVFQVSADGADDGESATFDALDTTMDHDGASSDELEPECMDCEEMLMTEEATAAMLKAGAKRPKAWKLANDKGKKQIKMKKPAHLKAGPSPKISNRNSKLFKVKATPRAVTGAVMVDLEVEINPKMRDSFPDSTDPMACSTTKPYNAKQAGWFPIKLASTYVTKTGFKGSSRPQTTYLCIHKPVPPKPACTLTCGQGTCEQSFDGSKWTSTCACKAGYALKNNTCADINECSAAKSPCNTGATCTNTAGSFTCGCPGGKVASARGCVAAPAPSCAADCTTTRAGICLLTKTSATCTCPAGEKFDSNGVCQPLRQCAKDSCGPGSKCTDASTDNSIDPGDIRCTLPPGTAPRLAFNVKLPFVANPKGLATSQRTPLDIDECKIASVRAACGVNKCINIDRSTPFPKGVAVGATCGAKKFPPAPAPNATWNNAGNGSWSLPAQ